MADPLIPVARFKYVGACRYTGYVHKSIRLYLECGHEQQRKESQGVPARVRCRDCGRARPAVTPATGKNKEQTT